MFSSCRGFRLVESFFRLFTMSIHSSPPLILQLVFFFLFFCLFARPMKLLIALCFISAIALALAVPLELQQQFFEWQKVHGMFADVFWMFATLFACRYLFIYLFILGCDEFGHACTDPRAAPHKVGFPTRRGPARVPLSSLWRRFSRWPTIQACDGQLSERKRDTYLSSCHINVTRMSLFWMKAAVILSLFVCFRPRSFPSFFVLSLSLSFVLQAVCTAQLQSKTFAWVTLPETPWRCLLISSLYCFSLLYRLETLLLCLFDPFPFAGR